MRILGAITGVRGRYEARYFVVNLQTPEEAGSPFINDRTANGNDRGLFQRQEDAAARFKAEVRKLFPDISDERLGRMAGEELALANTAISRFFSPKTPKEI